MAQWGTSQAVREQVATWPSESFLKKEIVAAVKTENPKFTVDAVSFALLTLRRKNFIKKGKQYGQWIILKRPEVEATKKVPGADADPENTDFVSRSKAAEAARQAALADSVAAADVRTKADKTALDSRLNNSVASIKARDKATGAADAEFLQDQIDWGKALYSYIGHLKTELDNANKKIREYHVLINGFNDRKKIELDQKDEMILELRDNIAVLNRRIASLNSEKKPTKQTFTMAEVAKFKR